MRHKTDSKRGWCILPVWAGVLVGTKANRSPNEFQIVDTTRATPYGSSLSLLLLLPSLLQVQRIFFLIELSDTKSVAAADGGRGREKFPDGRSGLLQSFKRFSTFSTNLVKPSDFESIPSMRMTEGKELVR